MGRNLQKRGFFQSPDRPYDSISAWTASKVIAACRGWYGELPPRLGKANFRTRKPIDHQWNRCRSTTEGKYGGLGRIRTPDPLIRSQVLYPTELPIRDTGDVTLGYHRCKCKDRNSLLYSAAFPISNGCFGSVSSNSVPVSLVLSSFRLPP